MVEFHYRQYRCESKDPLNCAHAQQQRSLEQDTRTCGKCGFPAMMLPQEKIRGSQGTYEITQWLGSRGMGRLYAAVELPDDRPVVVREYVLPHQSFNSSESRLRKQAFMQLAHLDLADGRSQDVRLVLPQEAIADPREERCYLVTSGILNAAPTLNQQLVERGTMTGKQVRRVLEQVLQSLDCLNSQKFRLHNGQVQTGLTHGNLSLDTLLFMPATHPSTNPWGEDFQIYLVDLALWEFLFAPPTTLLVEPAIAEDLSALGHIAFYLLSGSAIDPTTKQPLDPKTSSDFPTVSPGLKDFILRLGGLGVPFNSYAAARQALLKLPPESRLKNAESPLSLERGERSTQKFPWKTGLLWLVLALLAGWLGWWLWGLLQSRSSTETGKSLCCIQNVTGIPPGDYAYTTNTPSLGSYVLRQPNLVEWGKTLEQALLQQQPKLVLRHTPEQSTEAALERVRSRRAEFFVTSLVNDITPDFRAKSVAYDGLIVFVPFSYARRDDSLPQFLQGQISIDQLRRFYTGEITNWRQIGGPNLPVKLYIPPDPEAVKIFEQQVLRDERSIALFRNLRSTIVQQPTSATLRQVIQEFENNQVGAIAFGSLSQVFGQCAVYPLALTQGNQKAVQPLIQADGQPITPQTNLCAAKGSYDRNVSAFQTGRYPLSYPLAIVFPSDNRRLPVGEKFAEMLQTDEGQQLLSRTGVVPLRTIPKP